MSTCPACHAQNEEGAAFCDNCGAQLPQPGVAPQAPQMPAAAPVSPAMPQPVMPAPAYPAPGPQPTGVGYAPAPAAGGVCATCGTPLTPGAAYCDNCGAPVSQQQPTQPPFQQPAQPQYPPPVQPQYQPPAQPQYPPSVQPQYQPPAQPQYAPPYQQPVYGGPPRLVAQPTNAQIMLPPGKSEYIVGREDPVSNIFPDVDMTLHGGDESGVGRRHARLFQQGGQWYLEDLNSTNGTWVNNQKLQPAAPMPLQNGAELRFGRAKVTFYVQ